MVGLFFGLGDFGCLVVMVWFVWSCFIGWLVWFSLVRFSLGCLVGWLVGWLVGCLVAWLLSCLVAWSVPGWEVGGQVG